MQVCSYVCKHLSRFVYVCVYCISICTYLYMRVCLCVAMYDMVKIYVYVLLYQTKGAV